MKDYHTAIFLHFPAPWGNQRWGLLISRYEHLDPRSIAMWWMGTFKLLWPNENANGSTPVCVIHQQSWKIFALPVWNCDWFELKSWLGSSSIQVSQLNLAFFLLEALTFQILQSSYQWSVFFCIWFLSGFCCWSDLTVFQPSQEKLEQQLWIWTWPCKIPSLLKTGVCNKRLDEKTQH